MKMLKTLLITLFMITTTMFLSACNVINVHEHGYERNGPPPHAPAHGYRHKHRGHTLEYDHELGVYIVIGWVGHYFIDGIYYKKTDRGWYSSHDIDRSWNEYRKDVLPGKLHKKYGHEKKDRRKNDKHRKKKYDDDDD